MPEKVEWDRFAAGAWCQRSNVGGSGVPHRDRGWGVAWCGPACSKIWSPVLGWPWCGSVFYIGLPPKTGQWFHRLRLLVYAQCLFFWGKGLAHGFWHKQTHGDPLVSSTNISREEGLKLTYEFMRTMCDPSWTCVWLHNFTLGIFTNHVDILQGWAHSDSNSYNVVILTQRVSKLYGDFWLSSPARSRGPQKLCADPTKKKLCILLFFRYIDCIPRCVPVMFAEFCGSGFCSRPCADFEVINLFRNGHVQNLVIPSSSHKTF